MQSGNRWKVGKGPGQGETPQHSPPPELQAVLSLCCFVSHEGAETHPGCTQLQGRQAAVCRKLGQASARLYSGIVPPVGTDVCQDFGNSVLPVGMGVSQG